MNRHNTAGSLSLAAFLAMLVISILTPIEAQPSAQAATKAEIVPKVEQQLQNKQAQEEKQKEAEVKASPQTRCLAMNIYHEARGESERGQEAVGFVTLNRVESGRFPDSVCGVVHQRNGSRGGCQFSWVCDSRSDAVRSGEDWAEARRIAEWLMMNYEDARDPTRGALFYHATYVRPVWSRIFERTAQIGHHIFYRA